jgi:type IV pilus assembly protein PilM
MTASFPMTSLTSFLEDPPPAYAFELSEAGIAFARVAEPAQVNFTPLGTGVLSVSPAHDNLHQPQVVEERIHALAPPNGHRKRRAALILPDYCARVAVLDFDNFPTDPDEQVALLRFRMKKSVPFDVDSAVVSYAVQARRAGAGAKVEVLAALMGAEIVMRYEAPFRSAGFHPGIVTTSSLAALNLCEAGGITMLVKIGGRVLSVLVLDGSTLRLARCVETDSGRPEEIEAVLHPTVAYIEDELKAKPQRIRLCGFGSETTELARQWNAEWGVDVEPLQSRLGAPGENDAGLRGYLESVAR